MNIKVGMLGAGFILKSHATAVARVAGAQLRLVADASLGRAKQAAQDYGFDAAAGSIEEMAASDCEVVHILLPPALHLEAATAMIAAGKSVFLEKPMGLDGDACAALWDLADAKGVVVGVNHNFLFAPRYEAMREAVKVGEIGRIDQLQVNWHFGLPILQFGPFDSWMLGAPANMLFELGPHLAAFVIDQLGAVEVIAATATNPIELAGQQTVYRHWHAQCRGERASAQLSISISPGQADRTLRIRGSGGSLQLDFGRDFGWRETTVSDNPIFDAYETARMIAKALGKAASADRTRRLRAALGKQPYANPFEESIFRSISAFYEGGVAKVDSRHDGRFATKVIRLLEVIADAAAIGRPSRGNTAVALPAGPPPTVLVVGGTGFIGRRLVKRLVEQGIGVRVMTRNTRAAAMEFDGLGVELFQGSHGDRDAAARALAGVESVYHLAKCEGKRWQDYVDGDIEPTRVLAEAAVAAGVKRFIYTGTIDSYASGGAGTTIDNSTKVDPGIAGRNFYARSKAACEALLQKMPGLPLVIVRPGIVIGAGSPAAHLGVGRFASETQVDYWGDGATPLPLVLADDVADALVLARDAPGIEGHTLLLTSPPMLTAREYVAEVAAYSHTKIEARARPAWRYWIADWVKEGAKNAVRHPNRRWPNLNDWRSKSHCARYDADETEQVLGWKPVHDRETMVARGILEAVDDFSR